MDAREQRLNDRRNRFTKDNAKSLKDWMTKGKIDVVTDDQAKECHDTEATVWAVVIKPWILIQSDNK